MGGADREPRRGRGRRERARGSGSRTSSRGWRRSGERAATSRARTACASTWPSSAPSSGPRAPSRRSGSSRAAGSRQPRSRRARTSSPSLGLLEKVRASVEAQRPELLPLFSPVAHVRLLVEEKEYGSANGALERLDAAARDTFEVRELEARVHLELGLAALAADRTDEAVAHWERAIERAEVRSRVAVPLSEAVLTRAKLLHSREDRDDAILLLQRALPLGERGILGVPLAHFLLERADGRIERASAGAGDGETDLGPAIAEMRGAVADLEEAVLLDPTNGGIRDRRNEAEDLLLALLARVRPGGRRQPAADEAVAAPPEEQAPAAGTSVAGRDTRARR